MLIEDHRFAPLYTTFFVGSIVFLVTYRSVWHGCLPHCTFIVLRTWSLEIYRIPSTTRPIQTKRKLEEDMDRAMFHFMCATSVGSFHHACTIPYSIPDMFALTKFVFKAIAKNAHLTRRDGAHEDVRGPEVGYRNENSCAKYFGTILCWSSTVELDRLVTVADAVS